jgi:hypothetical protein
MPTDFHELADFHFRKYQEHEAKAKEARSRGAKVVAEAEEQLAATFYSSYRAAKDCQ